MTGVDLAPAHYRKPQGFFVTLNVPSAADAARIFAAFATGGTVVMPFEKAFWSEGFGVLFDRFDIPWEINVAGVDVT